MSTIYAFQWDWDAAVSWTRRYRDVVETYYRSDRANELLAHYEVVPATAG